jgi:pyruvate-ferredoxin/flavodoxin oxidoreductase
MSYGNIYVAQVAFGAKDVQTVRAFTEAAAYQGPSLIIAYSHCIAHGYDLALGPAQQRLAVTSGYWPLFRFDPRRRAEGQNPLQLDSPAPNHQLAQFMANETRFRMVEQKNPQRYKELLGLANNQVNQRFALYQRMAESSQPTAGNGTPETQKEPS